jgi:hypothetical protein
MWVIFEMRVIIFLSNYSKKSDETALQLVGFFHQGLRGNSRPRVSRVEQGPILRDTWLDLGSTRGID